MKDDYKNKLASKIASRYQDLEEHIMQDIVRRIVKAGEITSTADWQINRLRILGYSSEDIEQEIKKTLNASYPEMFELYDKVINWEYVRNKGIYEQINAEYIPFEENGQLRQRRLHRQWKQRATIITSVIARHTETALERLRLSIAIISARSMLMWR